MKYKKKMIRHIECFRFGIVNSKGIAICFVHNVSLEIKNKFKCQVACAIFHLKLLTDVEIRLGNDFLFTSCCTTKCDYHFVCIVRIKKVHLTLEFRIHFFTP